ncbi:MAG: hypothetical protein VX438_00065, partial [Planctomycetota bacterium]|nr:hypothetical protein [Planctomycetota bacterium]
LHFRVKENAGIHLCRDPRELTHRSTPSKILAFDPSLQGLRICYEVFCVQSCSFFLRFSIVVGLHPIR